MLFYLFVGTNLLWSYIGHHGLDVVPISFNLLLDDSACGLVHLNSAAPVDSFCCVWIQASIHFYKHGGAAIHSYRGLFVSHGLLVIYGVYEML
jgi:hypothetical protein